MSDRLFFSEAVGVANNTHPMNAAIDEHDCRKMNLRRWQVRTIFIGHARVPFSFSMLVRSRMIKLRGRESRSRSRTRESAAAGSIIPASYWPFHLLSLVPSTRAADSIPTFPIVTKHKRSRFLYACQISPPLVTKAWASLLATIPPVLIVPKYDG